MNDIEITIDPNYQCHFDKKTFSLSITRPGRIVEGFWGAGIHSVAAIVGGNGVGKSTVVEFILQAVVEGARGNDIDGILAYEAEGELFVYSKDYIHLPKGAKRLDAPDTIQCLYYSGHFVLDMDSNNLRSGELAGSYNISDGFLLMKDVERYSNIDHHHGKLSFYDHCAQHKALDHIRICRMLANNVLYEKLKDFIIPKYVVFALNNGGLYAFQRYQESFSGDDMHLGELKMPMKHQATREIVLTKYIYYNFLSLIFNNGYFTIDETILKSLLEWEVFFDGEKPVLSQFEVFIRTRIVDEDQRASLLSVYKALSAVNQLATFDNNGFFYLSVADDYEKLKSLCDLLENQTYLTANFFDIQYAMSLNETTCLSSGEQNLLNLFSRLYSTIQKDPEHFANLTAPALLILDEAEQAFHPDWHRQYIHLLIWFLQRLELDSKLKFQLLITTHSPILLSDIPYDCITFLRKGDDGVTRNVHPEMSGTFAANVFELYRNSFFMEKGMIGEFAAFKLHDLEERVSKAKGKDKESVSLLLKEIALIGDLRIRDYLINKMPLSCNYAKMEYYQSMINELKEMHRDE